MTASTVSTFSSFSRWRWLQLRGRQTRKKSQALEGSHHGGCADCTDENKRGDRVNRWAQFSVKLPAVSFNDTNVAELNKLVGKQVELVDAEIKVYGDYQNMLSIKVGSLRVVSHGQAKVNQ